MSTAREIGERIKDTIRREGILRKDTEFAIDSLVRLVSLAQPGEGAMTDEQINKLVSASEVYEYHPGAILEFAREIERAHGITSTPTGDSNAK